jgi:hypothetical protein
MKYVAGKPIAVTHSRGKGPSHDSLQSREQEEDWRRRHEAETADDYGAAAKITNPNFQQIKEASNTDDVFSSMAEIASCSYEARRVSES